MKKNEFQFFSRIAGVEEIDGNIFLTKYAHKVGNEFEHPHLLNQHLKSLP